MTRELWCVRLPIDPAKPDATTTLPARDREHADRLADKLGGHVEPWTKHPGLHEAMVSAFDRVLGNPKGIDTGPWLAAYEREDLA